MGANENQKIELLLDLTQCLVERQIVKTRFYTLQLPTTAQTKGIPIGDGKCKGVLLYVNSLVRDTVTKAATADNLAQIYYGDAQGQERELLAGQTSDVLFCSDLSEIYVRGNSIATVVQVTVYLGVDDSDENF